MAMMSRPPTARLPMFSSASGRNTMAPTMAPIVMATPPALAASFWAMRPAYGATTLLLVSSRISARRASTSSRRSATRIPPAGAPAARAASTACRACSSVSYTASSSPVPVAIAAPPRSFANYPAPRLGNHREGRVEPAVGHCQVVPLQRWALPIVAVAAVLLAAAAIGASGGGVSGLERNLFRAVNDAPGWLAAPAWLIMQLGNGLAPLVVAAVALAWRRPVLAAAFAVAGVLAYFTAIG